MKYILPRFHREIKQKASSATLEALALLAIGMDWVNNDEFPICLLNRYNSVLNHYGRFEKYSFCIGLVFYYRGNAPMARVYLQWVADHPEQQHYVHTAESLLKKLPPH